MGEKVLLLQSKGEVDIGVIHTFVRGIEGAMGNDLIDIVPAYDSIAIFTDRPLNWVAARLTSLSDSSSAVTLKEESVELPICYELGLDWDELISHCGLSKEDIIDIHLAGSYRSLFMGFTPGFIYADGLDVRLSCPRKENPRTSIEAGSVGIGGTQTGIYSLGSPGGWNIIGRTPIELFDINDNPPTRIEVGSRFSFRRISSKEFEEWES